MLIFKPFESLLYLQFEFIIIFFLGYWEQFLSQTLMEADPLYKDLIEREGIYGYFP